VLRQSKVDAGLVAFLSYFTCQFSLQARPGPSLLVGPGPAVWQAENGPGPFSAYFKYYFTSECSPRRKWGNAPETETPIQTYTSASIRTVRNSCRYVFTLIEANYCCWMHDASIPWMK